MSFSNLSILIIILLSLGNIPHYRGCYNELSNTITRYAINATLFPENRTLEAMLNIRILNSRKIEFTKLYFHFYPNSKYFRFKGGRVLFLQVFRKEHSLVFSFKGDDLSILEILLDKPLKPYDEYSIFIKYKIVIPHERGRYGYYNKIFAIGNWYPILAVYNGTDWILNPYYPYGESFYSEAASYDVTIKIPKDYVVAATGKLVEVEIRDNYAIYRWHVDLARDFAWTASKNYLVEKTTLETGSKKIEIYAYLLKSSQKYSRKILTYASQTIKTYIELFGDYPYTYYRICEVCADFAGMEYPALVMIASDVISCDELLEIVIAHETAHQWWYNVVGNDQAAEPWLDEALAEYSQLLYIEHIYGRERFASLYWKYILNPYYSNLPDNRTTPTLGSIWDFKNSREYLTMVYLRGAAFLHMLRNVIGYEKFILSLETYYYRFYFRIARTEDLITVFEEVTGQDLKWFFKEWLARSETPSFRLTYAKAFFENGKYVLKIGIHQGNVTQPFKTFLPVSIHTLGGTINKIVYVYNFENEITIYLNELPLEVLLDPENDFLGFDYDSPKNVELVAKSSTQPVYVVLVLGAILIFLVGVFYLTAKSRK